MKSKALPLFKFYGDNYISPEISLEEIEKMCKAVRKDHFQLKIRKNEFKTLEDNKPDYVFWVIVDLKDCEKTKIKKIKDE